MKEGRKGGRKERRKEEGGGQDCSPSKPLNYIPVMFFGHITSLFAFLKPENIATLGLRQK